MVSALTAAGLPLYLFLMAYAAWIVSELVGASLLPRLRAGGTREVARSDRGSRAEIVLGIVLAVLLVAFLAHAGLATLPWGYVYAGTVLMVSGVAIRQWAIAVLGRYFSTSVRLLEHHQVVRAGPYRLVRHPSYTGATVTLLGLGLAGGSWEGVVVILGVAAVVFGYRIRVEEQFLVRQLGAEYVAYRAGTKRIIPFLL